jgi:hypothetical protein
MTVPAGIAPRRDAWSEFTSGSLKARVPLFNTLPPRAPDASSAAIVYA